ncbi:DUF6992 family protein [Natronoflexus pectinivorans]|uniref:Uncharacterized protein n=1 Tax=Natronoflexus pectinivorans TaxID=682526 RepID=A0A4R2GIH7_9BACT|nr:hypothetical protein [Natronoflexus pectinivorans]TCO08379.1 hypothetical protein EV194_105183 [Natronoflexus pectinivorans]
MFQRFKLPYIVLMLSVISLTLDAQNPYYDFFEESQNITNKGMYVLGTWAVANIALGVNGWIQSSGEQKYFHQMNTLWNGVNLTIATWSLASNYGRDIAGMDAQEMISHVTGLENLLLINAGLDLLYIAGGFVMRHQSRNSEKRADLLKGYGNSVILQGGFLLVFDLILYGVINSHKSNFLNDIELSMSPGMGQLTFSF